MPAGKMYRPFASSNVVRANRLRKKVVPVKIVSKKKPNKRKVRNVVYNNGPSLIPDTYITKMSYTSELTDQNLEVVGPRLLKLSMSGNSVYDPDQTQLFNGWPVGYAEMRHFYKRFYVSASTISVQTMVRGGTVADGWRVMILPSNTKDIGTLPFNSLISNPYAGKSQYVGSALGKPIIHQRHRMSTSSMTGKKSPSIENDYNGELKLGGPLQNGDPIRQWFYLVFFETINDAFAPDTLRIQVKITYNVKFYDRRLQIQDNTDTLERPIGELDKEIPVEEEGPPFGPP